MTADPRYIAKQHPSHDGCERIAAAGPSFGWKDWLFIAGLLVVVVLAYQPAWQGGLLWDDDAHVTPAALRSWHGLWRIWFDVGTTLQYYPLLHSAFWIEHKLWGDATLGYHLLNIFLHATAAGMVALILRRLAVPGAYIAAAIFALHPVQVESVAWISEQKNTLSAVFYLAAGMVYLRFDRTRMLAWYLGGLGLFILALLSKTVTATLPGALLVVFWWQRGGLSWKKDVLPLAPFFLLGAGAGVITARYELSINRCVGPDFDFTFVQRLLIAGRAVWFYCGKLVWPTDLAFIYPRWQIDAGVWWQYVFPLAAAVLLAVLWALRRWSRGPLAAMLFFGGTLFPVLGFFNLYTFRYALVANHYQYLASLGVITLASASVAVLLDRRRLWGRPAGYLLCLALLAVLAGLTWRQCRKYTDVETLYRATIQENPDCWMACNNLGVALANLGRVNEAMAYYRKTLEIKPDHAEAHNSLGLALVGRGRVDEAIAHYRKAVEANPEYLEAHGNLGVALAGRGDFREAVAHYRKVLQIKPDDALAMNNLAWVMATSPDVSLRDGAAAIDLAGRAIQLSDGRSPDYFDTLAAAYAEAGRFADAVETAERALTLASSQKNSALADALRARIRLYRAGSPYRE